jgi:hypothetical protein
MASKRWIAAVAAASMSAGDRRRRARPCEFR